MKRTKVVSIGRVVFTCNDPHLERVARACRHELVVLRPFRVCADCGLVGARLVREVKRKKARR